jgi:DNA-binding beta-propeller fold protein YncE
MSHRNVRRLVGGALVVLPVMVLWALRGPDTEQTKETPQRPARPAAAPSAGRRPLGGDIGPDTTVWDPYPTFNGITLDLENDRVFMSDLNRHSVLTYARTAASKGAEPTAPLRHVLGPATELGFVSGIAVDPERREIFVAENDAWGVRVFSYDDHGNATPKRILAAPHQTWGLSLSRPRNEIALTVEELDAVVVYRKEASQMEAPLRAIRGDRTAMADPHGIYLDAVNNEIVVANHGNHTTYHPNTSHDDRPAVIPPSTGRFEMPSLGVYPALADGDVAPTRTIQGAKTRLNWPMQVDVDTVHNEIAVANFGDDSIVIFKRLDAGNVGPSRTLKGPHTGISGPIGVNVDAKNNELWVANYGDHTALVFDRTADGDATPKRTLRNAPADAPTCGFTDASAAAYDSKRDEVLVAN